MGSCFDTKTYEFQFSSTMPVLAPPSVFIECEEEIKEEKREEEQVFWTTRKLILILLFNVVLVVETIRSSGGQYTCVCPD